MATPTLRRDKTFPKDLQLGDVRKNNPDLGAIEWKRPKELVSKPVFIDEDGASRSDVNQHALGDCWFLSSAATLTYHPELFAAVVPTNQNFDKDYTGEFTFNFWNYGTWQPVTIDDRLPREKGRRGLLFCYNNTNPSEFWPALLEKAYAKLRGSYGNLDGNFPENALVDFTGGIGHSIDLNNPPTALFQYLLTHDARNTLMSISSGKLDGKRTGLVEGHEYSITKVATISTTDGKLHQLLRLRNPWGQGEWKGTWSRKSKQWHEVSADVKQKFKENIGGKENGEFWISYHDVLKNFDTVALCFLPSTAPTVASWRAWNSLLLKGSWAPQTGSFNPHSDNYWNVAHIISIKKPRIVANRKSRKTGEDEDFFEEGTFVVSVMRKIDAIDESHKFGFYIYQAKSDKPLPKLTSSNYGDLLSLVRSVQTEQSGGREVSACLHRDHGTFVIVPHFDNATEYLLRLIAGSELTEVRSSTVRRKTFDDGDGAPSPKTRRQRRKDIVGGSGV